MDDPYNDKPAFKKPRTCTAESDASVSDGELLTACEKFDRVNAYLAAAAVSNLETETNDILNSQHTQGLLRAMADANSLSEQWVAAVAYVRQHACPS